MNIRKGHQTSTIIYIPPAHRPVRKLRFYRMIALSIIAVITSVIITFVVMQFRIHFQAQHKISWLEQQMDTERIQHQERIAQKDETIEMLQLDVYELTQAAESIKIQMEELKRLEQEIRSLSDEAEIILDDLGAMQSQQDEGVGGELHQLSEHLVREWMDDTKETYLNLEFEMNHLSHLLEQAKQSLQLIEDMQRHLPSIWPTDSRRVSSHFGIRKDPFTQKLTLHTGIDIAGSLHAEIYATAKGTVEQVGKDAIRGNYVLVDHGNGLKTSYMHLQKATVSKGDEVDKGDPVGTMGSTGRSTGVHLHYEVLKNGQAVNPKLYME